MTFTATATNAGANPAYQWEINSVAQIGATSSVYTTSSLNNGDVVACAVTSSGQCGDQAGNGAVTMNVNSNSNVGVKGVTNGTELVVLPNPNKGQFTVSGTIGTGPDELVSIEVTDLLGQVIYQSKVMTNNRKLSQLVSLGKNTANGMYLLTLRTDEEHQVFHLVIEQ